MLGRAVLWGEVLLWGQVLLVRDTTGLLAFGAKSSCGGELCNGATSCYGQSVAAEQDSIVASALLRCGALR